MSRVLLAGFTNRSESEYDPFGAGHSSTSISAILGMAVGSDFKVQAGLRHWIRTMHAAAVTPVQRL